MRFLFHIAYDGSPYFGWQRQPGHISVQQVIEETMARITKTRLHCQGCGRTDTGVHAGQYFFHADLAFIPGDEFLYQLNLNLPEQISAFGFYPVGPQFHAQHSAIARTYHYFVHQEKDAFFAGKSLWYPQDLDWQSIREAVALLHGKHNFKAFCLTPEKHNTTSCEIFRASLGTWGDKRHFFTFKANRFVRGMIRLLVGNLVEIGKGRLSLETFRHHLETGEQMKFHNIAPPQGLYLSGVEYPGLDIPRQGRMPGEIELLD